MTALTLNRFDFFRLHKETQEAHAGIIVCTRDDADPPALAARIHSAIAATGNPAGRLLRVVRPSLPRVAESHHEAVLEILHRQGHVNPRSLTHTFAADSAKFYPSIPHFLLP